MLKMRLERVGEFEVLEADDSDEKGLQVGRDRASAPVRSSFG
jgi:hypothetical protein